MCIHYIHIYTYIKYMCIYTHVCIAAYHHWSRLLFSKYNFDKLYFNIEQ